MQEDPALEWRRLAEHYRAMSDDELRELALEFGDLTEAAQQALSAEMHTRGMGRPQDVAYTPQPESSAQLTTEPGDDWAVIPDPSVNALGYFGRPPKIVSDTPGNDVEVDGPHEYTWKTVLCECDTSEQAQQLREALKRAGIESWIDAAESGSRYAGFGLASPRVIVAADQLEAARAIASRPIPQEIVDESKTEAPEYLPPVCPKCGAADPSLEGVDPENKWRCEQCGGEWTESEEITDEETGQSS
jgi:hypothetical protein